MTIDRLGRTLLKIENTVRCIGVEVDDALVLVEWNDVEFALATMRAWRRVNAKRSGSNGACLRFFAWPWTLAASRMTARGLVGGGYGFGLRSTARSSIRPRRLPTRRCAMSAIK